MLGPNINVPMDPEANAPAIAALREGAGLAAGASEKEKGLIEAVATRYSADPAAERPQLDAAFADATAALSDKYPDDLELAVLAAEAAMDTQPWDYWQPGGKEPKGRTADILKRLEGVLAKTSRPSWCDPPLHPPGGSLRPPRARRALCRPARRADAGSRTHRPYAEPHLLSHRPLRGFAEANEAASKVDENYITQTGAVGVYPIGYYSHNIHFVLVSAQLLGDPRQCLPRPTSSTSG